MSTIQKLIRDAIVSAITTQVPTVTVFRAPRREIAESELPCVCVFSTSDRPLSSDDDHAEAHQRVYTVRVEVRALGRPEEDATDTLAVAIRKAVLTDDTLGRNAYRTTWDAQAWDGSEDENPLAGTALDFACHYFWRPE